MNDTSSNAKKTTNPATQDPGTEPENPSVAPPTPSDPLTQSLITALTQENEALKTELEEAKKKTEETLKMCQNALADLQNFRRRSEEEKAAFIEFANANFIKTVILPFQDNMYRALTHEPKDAEWIKGVQQTYQLFETALANAGLKPLPSIGQKMDPRMHEVLMTGPGEKDVIIQEIEKGYLLGEKIIKPAKVIVGNGEIPTAA